MQAGLPPLLHLVLVLYDSATLRSTATGPRSVCGRRSRNPGHEPITGTDDHGVRICSRFPSVALATTLIVWLAIVVAGALVADVECPAEAAEQQQTPNFEGEKACRSHQPKSCPEDLQCISRRGRGGYKPPTNYLN